jgi:hypothetical protein
MPGHSDSVGDGSAMNGVARLVETAQLTVREWVQLIAEACGFERLLTDDEIDFLLWEKTAYPVAGTDYVQRQLIELFERMKENQGE